MSKLVAVAATAAMVGALSMVTTPNAHAGGYGHRHGGGVFYGRPSEFYNGYRPYYGPFYGRPAGIFRPAGIVYRPFDAEPGPRYCRGWGWVYSHCGRYAKWRCLAW